MLFLLIIYSLNFQATFLSSKRFVSSINLVERKVLSFEKLLFIENDVFNGERRFWWLSLKLSGSKFQTNTETSKLIKRKNSFQLNRFLNIYTNVINWLETQYSAVIILLTTVWWVGCVWFTLRSSIFKEKICYSLRRTLHRTFFFFCKSNFFRELFCKLADVGWQD